MNAENTKRPYWTLNEAADAVGVSIRTIQRNLQRGDIKRGLRKPSIYKVDAASLMQYYRS